MPRARPGSLTCTLLCVPHLVSNDVNYNFYMTIKGHFPLTIKNKGINECIVFSFLSDIIIFAFVSIRQIRNVTSLEKTLQGD